jgi:MFS family permease
VEHLSRSAKLILFAVMGAGVFLAGLELMVTAVALPSIVTGLASWSRLREASWVVNGYLLVYVTVMPVAGRLADLRGTRGPLLGALAVFTAGSALAGAAPSLELLVAARLVQAIGAGALVPVATAAAAHLVGDEARPRALGLIGALTFLGMAAGPFVGAAILDAFHPAAALARLGIDTTSPLTALFAPAWRWVFYVNVPIGIIALVVAWAVGRDADTPRRPGAVDGIGAALAGIALVGALGALTLLGSKAQPGGPEPWLISAGLAAMAVAAGTLAVRHGNRRADPFLDPALFRRPAFASAVVVSVITGYGFATAIIGAAVFVDRVLYGGPADQRLTLGALAAATAAGSLVAGLAARRLGLKAVTIAGLVLAVAGLVVMARWSPQTTPLTAAAALAVFGAGFGLTVTPRTTAATDAVSASAYGAAASAVTVARMAGMAVGLAVLAAYGSTTIDRLYDQVYATPDAYKAFVPPELRGRPLRDAQVVGALEAWAAGEAAQIMSGVFLVAALVTATAAVPAVRLGRRRMLGEAGSLPAPTGGLNADDRGSA